MNSVVNLAAYKFVSIAEPAVWRDTLRSRCASLDLRGTILLAPEGINLFVAGSAENVDAFTAELQSADRFDGLFIGLKAKRSVSETQPFNRMLVKLKKEIITLRAPAVQPHAGRAPAVEPETLKAWLDAGIDDAGRPVVLLDTRNAFEVELGTFRNAVDWKLARFSDFPDALASHRDDWTGKTVVSFCTGGIRCEKAALHMQAAGIEHVYQLEGGILNYFEKVGDAHYDGDCFVFDHRTALTPQLEPSPAPQCGACQAILTAAEQASPLFVVGRSCPHCHVAPHAV
ncbi:MAG: sulfurtransferase [Janthinobacterium lividum]